MVPFHLVRLIKVTRLKKHVFIHDCLDEDSESGLIPAKVVEEIHQSVREKYLPPTRGWKLLRVKYDGEGFELEELHTSLYGDSPTVDETIDEYENTMVRLGSQIFGES